MFPTLLVLSYTIILHCLTPLCSQHFQYYRTPLFFVALLHYVPNTFCIIVHQCSSLPYSNDLIISPSTTLPHYFSHSNYYYSILLQFRFLWPVIYFITFSTTPTIVLLHLPHSFSLQLSDSITLPISFVIIGLYYFFHFFYLLPYSKTLPKIFNLFFTPPIIKLSYSIIFFPFPCPLLYSITVIITHYSNVFYLC